MTHELACSCRHIICSLMSFVSVIGGQDDLAIWGSRGVEASHGSVGVESFGHWAMVSSRALAAGQPFGSSLFGMSRPTTSLSYLFNATLFLFLALQLEHCY